MTENNTMYDPEHTITAVISGGASFMLAAVLQQGLENLQMLLIIMMAMNRGHHRLLMSKNWDGG